MTTVTTIAFVLIAIAAVLNVARIIRPNSGLPDRALGLDTLLVSIVSGSAVLAARTGTTIYLDLIVATSLLGFLSTVTLARFIETRTTR